MYNTYHRNIETPEDCQAECQDEPGCGGWSWGDKKIVFFFFAKEVLSVSLGYYLPTLLKGTIPKTKELKNDYIFYERKDL